MISLLKSFEDFFLFTFNVSSISYALFQFYRFGNEHDIQECSDYVENGWSLLYRMRLEFDFEYDQFFTYVTSSVHWLIVHGLCCELVRCINAKQVPVVHAVFGILYLLFTYKPPFIATFIVVPITFYFVMQIGKKLFVWLTLFSWLCFAGLIKMDKHQRNFIPGDLTIFDIYIGMTVVGWQILRLTSFALDYCETLKISTKNPELIRKFSVINLIGFGFYLPVFSQGPPIIFSNYLDMINRNSSGKNVDLSKRVGKLLHELLRLAGTSFIAIFMMHFLYTDAVIYDPYLLEQLKGWPLYGMIISTGLYFSLVYMLKYQLGGALARFDRISAPAKPKCCLRIHKNSLTWRNLDKGLYDFVLKYIHIPTGNLKSKWNKCGRLFVFIFVTLWHCLGNQLWIFFWVWSNFGILYLEMFGQFIIKSKAFRRLLKIFGSGTMDRINKLFGSQLLIIQTCSAMLFLTGRDQVLVHIIRETYFNNTLSSYSILSLAMYSLYHISDLIFRHEKKNHKINNF